MTVTGTGTVWVCSGSRPSAELVFWIQSVKKHESNEQGFGLRRLRHLRCPRLPIKACGGFGTQLQHRHEAWPLDASKGTRLVAPWEKGAAKASPSFGLSLAVPGTGSIQTSHCSCIAPVLAQAFRVADLVRGAARLAGQVLLALVHLHEAGAKLPEKLVLGPRYDRLPRVDGVSIKSHKD